MRKKQERSKADGEPHRSQMMEADGIHVLNKIVVICHDKMKGKNKGTWTDKIRENNKIL